MIRAMVALLAFSSPISAQTSFSHDVHDLVERAEASGITHTYDGPWEYFVGGGAASFDCNGDRMPDLFLAGGANTSRLFVNRSKPRGALQFEEKEIGERPLKKVTGAYPVNIDNDAFMDLVVLRVGKNMILKGGPDCSFEPANDLWNIDGGKEWTTAFSAIWEEGEEMPSLAFGNYVDRDAPGSPWGTCHDNFLIRPTSGEYGEADLLSPGFCALSMLFTDWNNNGQFDLRMTNDRQYHRGGREQLWDLREGGRPREFTNADGWRKLVIWGMGIAARDLTGDGRPEYALSSMGDTMLQSLDEDAEDDSPVYRDIAFEKGTTAHRPYTGEAVRPSTGWHTQFEDMNNDSFTDLFIAKGNVEAMTDFADFDPDNLLMGTSEGVFVEKGLEAGIALDRRGRGAVLEDFNADGMVDLLVVNRAAPVSLFQNMGAKTDWGHRPMGNFLRIELNNGEVNPNAVGAVVTVKTGNVIQTRTVEVGGGHASGQSGFLHFGLGVAERAEVRIKWPGGDRSKPYRVFSNNFVVIEKGQDEARYWYAPE